MLPPQLYDHPPATVEQIDEIIVPTECRLMSAQRVVVYAMQVTGPCLAGVAYRGGVCMTGYRHDLVADPISYDELLTAAAGNRPESVSRAHLYARIGAALRWLITMPVYRELADGGADSAEWLAAGLAVYDRDALRGRAIMEAVTDSVVAAAAISGAISQCGE